MECSKGELRGRLFGMRNYFVSVYSTFVYFLYSIKIYILERVFIAQVTTVILPAKSPMSRSWVVLLPFGRPHDVSL